LKISAVLLAAGLSERMGRDKLLLEYRGETLLQHSANLLSQLPVFERIIITTEARAESLTLTSEIKVIYNPQPEKGQSGSVRLGIQAATGTHYLFLNADQPKLTPADIISLLSTVKTNPDRIVYPVIYSKPNSPAIFPESFRAELLKLTGDNGGRVIRDAHPELCLAVAPECPANFNDINNEEEYRGLF